MCIRDRNLSAPEKNESAPRDLPQAKITGRTRISIIWIVPLIAAIAAGWLVFKNVRASGPVITIQFNDGDGLQALSLIHIYWVAPVFIRSTATWSSWACCGKALQITPGSTMLGIFLGAVPSLHKTQPSARRLMPICAANILRLQNGAPNRFRFTNAQ